MKPDFFPLVEYLSEDELSLLMRFTKLLGETNDPVQIQRFLHGHREAPFALLVDFLFQLFRENYERSFITHEIETDWIN